MHFNYNYFSDVFVKCVKFVLPEDIDTCDTTDICNKKKLRARIISHYIDYDFDCCENIVT